MDKKVATVLKGFLALDAAGRKELIALVTNSNLGITQDSALIESIRKSTGTVNFGPSPGGCPCCGK